MARRAARRLPGRVKAAARWPYLAAGDLCDAVTGRRDPLTPPRRVQLAGWRGRYRQSGGRWRRLMIEVGGLQPHHQVLDVGSGSGRVAVALTGDLDGGTYDGFDIVPANVDWCRRAISSRHPNFRFELADIENAQYNPRGSQRASEYRFPYADGSFDLVVATSVFTHTRPDETARYLQEAARTLRPGGRLLSTFFLLNDESERMGAAGRARIDFAHEFRDGSGRRYWGEDPNTPEYAVALREADLRELCGEAGLRVEAIRHGKWAGRSSRGHGQDLLVAVRDE